MPPETRFLQAPDIRELAERTGVNPSKSKGQNFVIDANTVRKIVSLSGAQPGEHVLEVGPGFGSLTVGLVGAGCQVTAIEIDSRLAAELPSVIGQRAPGGVFDVIEADALRVESVPEDVVSLVANLPYNVAVPVLIHLLEIHPGFRRVLVMVQAEVGWRLAAPPGSEHYGAPSVKVAWWGQWAVESSISRRVSGQNLASTRCWSGCIGANLRGASCFDGEYLTLLTRVSAPVERCPDRLSPKSLGPPLSPARRLSGQV